MESEDPWVTDTKLTEIFGWTKGQIRGYKDRLWTRNQQFALIAGRLMFNPKEIIKWQNSQVLDQSTEESKSGGNTKVNPIADLRTPHQRKPTSKRLLGSVRSTLNSVN